TTTGTARTSRSASTASAARSRTTASTCTSRSPARTTTRRWKRPSRRSSPSPPAPPRRPDEMKTLYAACLSRLGLSQAQAAALHGVRLDTVKSWSAGRNPIPEGAWAELREYEAQIIDRSEAIREAWEDAGEVRDLEAAT